MSAGIIDFINLVAKNLWNAKKSRTFCLFFNSVNKYNNTLTLM